MLQAAILKPMTNAISEAIWPLVYSSSGVVKKLCFYDHGPTDIVHVVTASIKKLMACALVKYYGIL